MVSAYLLLNFTANYIILLGIFLLLVLLIATKNIKKIYYVLFFAIFNIIIFCGIYLITDLDLTFMLKNTMHRIMYQFSPFVFLIVLELLNSKFFKTN